MIEADGDTKVIYVDSNANGNEAKCVTGYTGYDFVSKPTDDGKYRNINAKYIMDGDKVAFILIDVKGDLSDEGTIENIAGLDGEVVSEAPVYNTPGVITIELQAENFYYNPFWQDANLVELVEITHADGTPIGDNDFTDVKNGYFDKDGSVTVSFKTTVDTDAGNYIAIFEGNTTTARVPFTVGKAKIDGFNLTYTGAPATAPKAGDSVDNLFKDFKVTSNDTSKVVWDVTLTKANAQDANRDIIASGDKVEVVVTITPDSNHVFDETAAGLAGNTADSALKIGGQAGLKAVVDGGNAVTITYTFTIGA